MPRRTLSTAATLRINSKKVLQNECTNTDSKKSNSLNTKRLLTRDEIPDYCKFNEYIISGYRGEWSIKDCFLSLFELHNETGNVWTHLLGFGLFVYVTYWLLFEFDASVQAKLVLMTYLLSTLGCLGISSIYHLFYCHSRTFDKVLTTADYIVMLAASQPATVAAVPAASRLSVRAGIAQLVVVSFYPPLFFGFSCWPNYRLLYMSAITVLGLVGLLGPLFSAFHLPRYRYLRCFIFAGTALSGVVPSIHIRFLITTHEDVHMRIYGMYLLYGAGLFIVCTADLTPQFYLTRLPERCRPGKFDFWLHSHQIWHVFVVAAQWIHFTCCIRTYELWLSGELCPA